LLQAGISCDFIRIDTAHCGGVISVEYEGFAGGVSNGIAIQVPASPVDVARAVATMCGIAPGLSSWRRMMRRGAIALEMLSHLRLVASEDGSTRNLVLTGVDGMERSDRAALSHRLGVGLARLVAEGPPAELVDLYYLDSLAREEGSHRLVSPVRPARALGTKRWPDMVGSDQSANWSVLEAKGQSLQKPSRRASAAAKSQARAIDLIDHRGVKVSIALRLASVAALAGPAVSVLFADPPADRPGRRYAIEPDLLVLSHYQPVRDVLALYGDQLIRVSDIPEFFEAPLAGTAISLLVHQEVVDALDSPAALRAVRAEFAQPWKEGRNRAREAALTDLSFGLDGLGLLVRGYEDGPALS
jgi:hypothetical protein